ncbi:MAG: PD-(D/E)XK nuclease family protein [Actinomycetota bacterium]
MAAVELESPSAPATALPERLPTPTGLSPSRISAFRDCGLAFRYSSIDKLPEPPSAPAALGTLVHHALELLFLRPVGERSLDAALVDLDAAIEAALGSPDGDVLGLGGDDHDETRDRAADLVARYFALEDPNEIRAVGLELRLEATIGGARIRGVIDRLDLAPDGTLVVTDYKTGRSPSQFSEQQRMLGVTVYSAMVEQVFGVRPSRIQLLYLKDPVAISTEPNDRQVRGLDIKVGALWQAIERACERADFRPKQSRLCDWCSFQAYCPAFDGDPAAAWAISAANPDARRPE